MDKRFAICPLCIMLLTAACLFAVPSSSGASSRQELPSPLFTPADGDEALKQAECYFALGAEQIKAGRFAEAAENFHAGGRLRTDTTRFGIYEGYALMRDGQLHKAEDALLRALQIDDSDPEALKMLGRIHYQAGRNGAAYQVWQQAIENGGEDPQLTPLIEKAAEDLKAERDMTRRYGANFIVNYDGQANPELGSQVLEVLEEAFLDVGTNLAFFPDVQVPVVLYSREQFSSVTGSPDWTGGLYDGKIRLPIGGIKRLHPPVTALLYHEYTHVLVRNLTRGNCPRWLNEGLAEWMARQQHAPPLDLLQQTLAGEGELLPLPQLEGSWDAFGREAVALAYQQSFAAVNHLLEQYGWPDLTRLFQELGSGLVFSQAFERVYGPYDFSYRQLEQGWLLAERSKLGKKG